MMQYLIIAGLIAFIYFFYFRKPSPKVAPSEHKKGHKKEEANEMVECTTCGVYSELDNAILSNAKYYCSDECVAKSKR